MNQPNIINDIIRNTKKNKVYEILFMYPCVSYDPFDSITYKLKKDAVLIDQEQFIENFKNKNSFIYEEEQIENEAIEYFKRLVALEFRDCNIKLINPHIKPTSPKLKVSYKKKNTDNNIMNEPNLIVEIMAITCIN